MDSDIPSFVYICLCLIISRPLCLYCRLPRHSTISKRLEMVHRAVSLQKVWFRGLIGVLSIWRRLVGASLDYRDVSYFPKIRDSTLVPEVIPSFFLSLSLFSLSFDFSEYISSILSWMQREREKARGACCSRDSMAKDATGTRLIYSAVISIAELLETKIDYISNRNVIHRTNVVQFNCFFVLNYES